MATDTTLTTDDAAEATTSTADDRTSSRQSDRATIRRLHKMLKRSKQAEKRYKPRGEESIEFYFGGEGQWDKDDLKRMKERGQPAITLNRVRPTTKLVHGLVIGQPQDWLAKPVGADDDNLAEIGTAALKFVANATGYKDKRALAYFWALLYGYGVAHWGFYVDNEDRRTEAVQMRLIDPREFRRDPMSRKLDGSDMRWGIWSRRMDLADAQDRWKKYADKLALMVNRTKDSDTDDIEKYEGVAALAATGPGYWDAADWNQADNEDEKGENKQVLIHELWEIRKETAQLCEHRNGNTEEYDPNDPEALAKLHSPDVVRFYEAKVPKVYYHVFCGTLLLESEPSPYKHDRIPFVICWHEMDQHGDPFSFIENLKDPQREINHRRSKMVKELNNPNIRVSPMVLQKMDMDRKGFLAAWHKGGMLVEAEPGQIEILRDQGMTPQQFELMQDSKAEIQSVSGVNDDLIGYDSSSKSGVAKKAQMDQGAMMQRPNESNLGLFDRLNGQMAFALIQQAHKGEWIVRVTDNVGADKYLGLNQPTVDPATGETRILNNINQVPYEIDIETKNWSPTDRQSSADQLIEMANGEQDPVIRTALHRAAIEVQDMPAKGKIMEIYDRAVSMMMQPPQGPPPEPFMRITANYADLPAPAQQQALIKDQLLQPGQPMGPADMVPAETMAKHSHDVAMASFQHQSQTAQQQAQAQQQAAMQDQQAQQQAALQQQAAMHQSGHSAQDHMQQLAQQAHAAAIAPPPMPQGDPNA
jgi:hypothetical protein